MNQPSPEAPQNTRTKLDVLTTIGSTVFTAVFAFGAGMNYEAGDTPTAVLLGVAASGFGTAAVLKSLR